MAEQADPPSYGRLIWRSIESPSKPVCIVWVKSLQFRCHLTTAHASLIHGIQIKESLMGVKAGIGFNPLSLPLPARWSRLTKKTWFKFVDAKVGISINPCQAVCQGGEGTGFQVVL
jgi:hypothetical protein